MTLAHPLALALATGQYQQQQQQHPTRDNQDQHPRRQPGAPPVPTLAGLVTPPCHRDFDRSGVDPGFVLLRCQRRGHGLRGRGLRGN